MDFIEQIINPRERVLVLCCDLIKLSVINAHPKVPILLSHKQQRSTIWRNTWLLKPFSSESLSWIFSFFNSVRSISYGGFEISCVSSNKSMQKKISRSRGITGMWSGKTYENPFSTRTTSKRGISDSRSMTLSLW